MRTLFLSGSALLAVWGTPVLAADLPLYDPAPYAAVSVSTFNWTGFYLGVHGGYLWGESDFSFDYEDPTPPDGSGSIELEGFYGGAQAGYNHQMGSFVLGLEADVSYGQIDGDVTVDVDGAGGFDPSDVEAELNWFGTVRARAGFAMDRLLVYATGGVAYANIDVEVTDVFGIDADTYDDDDWLRGWTLGAGVEVAATNIWTIGAEYRYLNFEDAELEFTDSGLPDGSDEMWTDADFDAHTVRIGASYRF